MEYAVEVMRLSREFWKSYPPAEYPELMNKNSRPYNCLLIDTHQDYFICIPFRSNIPHKNAYLFKNTQRSRKSRSGLDYTKTVLIRDTSFFDAAPAVVDQDEYREAMQNMEKIVHKAVRYIDRYIAHVSGSGRLHEREYQRDYAYSTLPYFHDILGLLKRK